MPADGPRPNLFIIGAAKSGTTSLHEYLDTHPDVFMCEPKEPGFFVEELDYYPSDEAWYRSIFAPAGDARIVGESSTHYSKLPLYPGVPERIARYSPDARFIYIMRDPIERAISHYWHNVRKFQEKRPIVRALREDVQYLALSDYRRQLEPYFDRFGRERVLLLTFEAMVRDPRRVLEEVLRWLGVDDTQGTTVFEKKNARPEHFRRLRGSGLLHWVSTTPAWARLSPRVPVPLKDAARRLAVRDVRPAETTDHEVADTLRPSQQDRVLDLEQFLEMEFNEWTTVFPHRSGALQTP